MDLPDDDLRQAVCDNLADDPLLAKVLADPDGNPTFVLRDQVVWYVRPDGVQVLCVPKGKLGERTIRGALIEEAHRVVGHYGPQRTSEYLRRWYWW
ncbi:hypothetical protein CYLTODRAFT_354607, partial [Cylindrobasidium torrendii FP15055 ss-10]